MQCDNNITLGSTEIATLVKPLFYQDHQHTLFIEPTVTETTITEWQNWVEPAFKEPEWEWPVVIPDIPRWIPEKVDPGDPVREITIDDNSIIKTGFGRDWVTSPSTALLFAGSLLGPEGRAGLQLLSSDGIGGALTAGGSMVSVHTGSEVASGSGVVARAGTTLASDGLVLTAGALNVVGGGGLKRGMFQNSNTSAGSRSLT
jgi:hypothetical protein